MKNEKELSEYLACSEYIDFDNVEVKKQAEILAYEYNTELELIKNTYYFVRDKISHSWDIQDKRVTISASDVLRERVGICWAKANLLAALLRANRIPSGFSYQRLTLGDTPDTGYCIHGLNTVYISSLNKWIRLDARGNTDKIHADFSTEKEILAFKINPQYDEYDYNDNHAKPNEKLMSVLKDNSDALYMYRYLLPDSLE